MLGRVLNLMRTKDPERFRRGIDPAWWCAPIVIGLAVGLLFLVFEFDGSNYAQQLLFPPPIRPAQNLKAYAAPDGSPERPDPHIELAEELKKELKTGPKVDAAVTQPSEILSPYEAAIRQQQKGK